jgi:hypothetical protein
MRGPVAGKRVSLRRARRQIASAIQDFGSSPAAKTKTRKVLQMGCGSRNQAWEASNRSQSLTSSIASRVTRIHYVPPGPTKSVPSDRLSFATKRSLVLVVQENHAYDFSSAANRWQFRLCAFSSAKNRGVERNGDIAPVVETLALANTRSHQLTSSTTSKQRQECQLVLCGGFQ